MASTKLHGCAYPHDPRWARRLPRGGDVIPRLMNSGQVHPVRLAGCRDPAGTPAVSPANVARFRWRISLHSRLLVLHGSPTVRQRTTRAAGRWKPWEWVTSPSNTPSISPAGRIFAFLRLSTVFVQPMHSHGNGVQSIPTRKSLCELRFRARIRQANDANSTPQA